MSDESREAASILMETDLAPAERVVDLPEPTAATPGVMSRTSTPAEFRRGMALGMPIFLGYVPVGLAFGVLATVAGFTVMQALVNSMTAIAGAGQFIGLSLLQGGSAVTGVIIATSVVNLRYVLFGSTVSPYLRGVPLLEQSWLAFTLTDETFAVNVADLKAKRSTVASMAGAGLTAWLGWTLGTAAGALFASWIGDPSRWGMDFAMPAMFTALFVALADDWRHVVTGLGAGAFALLLPLGARYGMAIPSSWYLIIAALAGATVASLVWRD